jgi:hypothetical protein
VKDEALRNRVTHLLQLAKKANDRRVDVVHSVWFEFDPPLEAWAFGFPRKGNYRVFELSDTYLEAVARGIQGVTQGLADLLPRLAEAVPYLKARWGVPEPPNTAG